MDEFAIQKGHRYATVIIEPTRKRVLWVGRGRDRAADDATSRAGSDPSQSPSLIARSTGPVTIAPPSSRSGSAISRTDFSIATTLDRCCR